MNCLEAEGPHAVACPVERVVRLVNEAETIARQGGKRNGQPAVAAWTRPANETPRSGSAGHPDPPCRRRDHPRHELAAKSGNAQGWLGIHGLA